MLNQNPIKSQNENVENNSEIKNILEKKPEHIKKVVQGRKVKKHLFSLNDLGKISLAKIHASANMPLHKIS